jgi:hypothetical protein
MSKHEVGDTRAILHAKQMSRFKKEKHLLQLSEDAFRDLVVRPLFFRLGLTDGRDLCGPDEEGKDSVFFKTDPIRKRVMYAVQTKRGNINMSRKATENITEAVAQLRTALQTSLTILNPREKRKPDCVVLCASGKINKTARDHIQQEVDDTRISFMDADDIIPEIDERYPEYWYGIDADKFPYYRSLQDELLGSSEIISLADVGVSDSNFSPITEDSFVQLHLYRITLETKKVAGKPSEEPKFEEIPVQAVLRKPERLVLITGDAGAGKSTSLRRIAYTAAHKALTEDAPSDIPVLIRCSELEAYPDRLIDLAAEVTGRVTKTQAGCFTTTDLNDGRVIILLDALDEVSTDEGRTSVLKKVKEFHESYGKCHVLLTSRKHTFLKENEELSTYASYHLCPFSFEQAERLVTQITRSISRPVSEIPEILRRIKDVHGVDLSPLLVTILVATSDYNRQDIPANITELFKKYTEMMLGRWDKQKGLAQQIHAPIKDFLLKSLAFTMHQRRKVSLPLGECRTLFEQELQSRGHQADLNILFQEIVYRSGLVRISGDEIEFRHLLIQEFFAGRAVPSMEFLKSVVGDRWWTKAVVFYFGENPADSDSFLGVIQGLREPNAHKLYTAATALGLATQACYLSKVSEKAKALTWVVKTLASVKEPFIRAFGEAIGKEQSSLLAFISYYLPGRDSVASKLISNIARELLEGKKPEGESDEVHEAMVFWALVGLVEIGELKVVEEFIRGYKPSDNRFLFGIHLGCYFVANLRLTSSAQKDVARRISARLSKKIRSLNFQLLDELKSLLLEERKGTIKALPNTPPKELLEDTEEGSQSEG